MLLVLLDEFDESVVEAVSFLLGPRAPASAGKGAGALILTKDAFEINSSEAVSG